MNKIKKIISEILDYKGVLRGRVFVVAGVHPNIIPKLYIDRNVIHWWGFYYHIYSFQKPHIYSIADQEGYVSCFFYSLDWLSSENIQRLASMYPNTKKNRPWKEKTDSNDEMIARKHFPQKISQLKELLCEHLYILSNSFCVRLCQIIVTLFISQFFNKVLSK